MALFPHGDSHTLLYIRDVGVRRDGVMSSCCEACFPHSGFSYNNYFVHMCIACPSLFPWPGMYSLAILGY